VFDYDGIAKIVQMLLEHETGIDDFFGKAGVQPFTVVYEDFVDAYEDTVSAVLQHLSIEVPKDFAVAAPLMARQADAETDAWVERYYQVMEERSRDVEMTSDRVIPCPP
jgi:LPS sulfotransferase NodH